MEVQLHEFVSCVLGWGVSSWLDCLAACHLGVIPVMAIQ